MNAENIKELMRKYCLTQVDVALALGVSQRTVFKILKGEKMPDKYDMINYPKVLREYSRIKHGRTCNMLANNEDNIIKNHEEDVQNDDKYKDMLIESLQKQIEQLNNVIKVLEKMLENGTTR